MATSWKQFAALAGSVVTVCATAACSSGGASQAAGHGTAAQSAVHTTPVTLTVGTDDFVTYEGAQQILRTDIATYLAGRDSAVQQPTDGFGETIERIG